MLTAALLAPQGNAAASGVGVASPLDTVVQAARGTSAGVLRSGFIMAVLAAGWVSTTLAMPPIKPRGCSTVPLGNLRILQATLAPWCVVHTPASSSCGRVCAVTAKVSHVLQG